MKNSEEALEKVLAGLRDCEAPVGMESRILRKVQDRASVRAVPGWRVLVPVWRAGQTFPAAAVFLVCALGLAGLFSAFVAIHQPGQTLSARSETRFSIRSSTSVPARNAVTSAVPAVPVLTAQGTQLPSRRASAQSIGKAAAQRVRNLRHADFSSRHSMQTVSYPAPPLPLTKQERLLLHVARHGDEADLAMLNPEIQAMRIVKEKEEFEEFFGQTTVKGKE